MFGTTSHSRKPVTAAAGFGVTRWGSGEHPDPDAATMETAPRPQNTNSSFQILARQLLQQPGKVGGRGHASPTCTGIWESGIFPLNRGIPALQGTPISWGALLSVLHPFAFPKRCHRHGCPHSPPQCPACVLGYPTGQLWGWGSPPHSITPTVPLARS